MDQGQMSERCPSSVLAGPAVLKNYRLAFTIYSPKRKCGCADVVLETGSYVYGLLYKLTDDDMARMDHFEGHPVHYQRTKVDIVFNKETLSAYTYEVVNKNEGVLPSKEYASLLQKAAKTFDFPKSYQDFLSRITKPEVLSSGL